MNQPKFSDYSVLFHIWPLEIATAAWYLCKEFPTLKFDMEDVP